MNNLKPCPFCGKIPWPTFNLNSQEKAFYQVRHVCMNMLSMIKTFCYPTEEEAIEAWNKRWEDEG